MSGNQRSQVACIGLPHPRTWADYRQGCIGTYRGGHVGREAEAFVHGMNTVFNLLEAEFPPAESCQATSDMLTLLRTAEKALRSYQYGNASPDLAEEIADAIAKTVGTATQQEGSRHNG